MIRFQKIDVATTVEWTIRFRGEPSVGIERRTNVAHIFPEGTIFSWVQPVPMTRRRSINEKTLQGSIPMPHVKFSNAIAIETRATGMRIERNINSNSQKQSRIDAV